VTEWGRYSLVKWRLLLWISTTHEWLIRPDESSLFGLNHDEKGLIHKLYLIVLALFGIFFGISRSSGNVKVCPYQQERYSSVTARWIVSVDPLACRRLTRDTATFDWCPPTFRGRYWKHNMLQDSVRKCLLLYGFIQFCILGSVRSYLCP